MALPLRYLVIAVLTLSVLFTVAPARAQLMPGVATLTGTVKITNPAVLEHLMVEAGIYLSDLVAFVKRDTEYKPAYTVQTITEITGDPGSEAGGRYLLPLPIVPLGESVQVGNGKGGTAGVKVFAAELRSNFYGNVFSGPYELGGWASANSSLRFSTGDQEVIGGRLVVYAPDDAQFFPSGFGPDGKLFTTDDPTGPLQSGWTVIDLDQTPFGQLRESTVEMPIYEGNTGSTDYAALSYTESFDKLIADLRVKYAFNELKQIDYDDLIRRFRPAIERAENTKNAELFKLALFRLSQSFNDGHVSAGYPRGYFAQYLGGVGLKLAETDDGEVIAVKVTDGLPADRAGIKRGAKILQWENRPIAAAIARVDQPFTHSAPHTKRLAQIAFLTRMAVERVVSVRYQNPGEAPKTARLTAVNDLEGLLEAVPFAAGSFNMPITVKRLESGMGYIQITTFLENPQLLVQTWEWAIRALNAEKAPGLIIDLRLNTGGFGAFPPYFAGSFFKESFVLYESARADDNGTFKRDSRQVIDPTPFQWEKPFAVLIGPECASACEIFAAALAQNPKAIIVGQYPTFGITGGLYGPWKLPEGVKFNAPVLLPTPGPNARLVGKDFLEGVGLAPTVRVPVTVENLLSDVDAVLAAAEAALKDAVE